ncbi:endonuclease [Lacinutrix jangbogonensis]|uniref:endonuclease n=1 Tax=Lacinutrix jangbogonensis TaxID=1469557 RepID=UPI00053F1C6E|nr:endonuclease [Lacinutrix jangbogonensis]
MKHLYITFTFLLTASIAFAQVPTSYYNAATGTGYTLKTQLKVITSNGHTARSYDQLYDGSGVSGSQGYIDTHSDTNVTGGANYEDDNTVLDMYSENPSGTDPYNFNHNIGNSGNQSNEGDCYNREHLVPQSSFNSNFPMQSDIHHVIPTDCRVNNFRGSLPFGNVASANWTSQNGSKRGSSGVIGYSGTMFEPIDEFKGDIARALLYFVTRYEDNIDGYTSFEMFNGTNDEVFFPWAITTLLDWHNTIDPVDERERLRNDEAYNFQGNANPFVDHPEYADMIWNPVLDSQDPTVPANLMASNPSTSSIDLSWTASTDNVSVITYDVYVNTAFYVTTNSAANTYTVTGLSPQTMYTFNVRAKDGSNNTSAQSNSASETTLPGTITTNEIFISEYVESGNNKALEIANFTGTTVNLSAYTIARDVNSNGAFGDALQLIGSITNGAVHVITKGNAESALTSLADQLSSADAMLFNGNDPVGLFKNGTLIDIFGTFGGSNDYDDIVYRRKPSVENPTTSFNLIAEWDAFLEGDYTNLGSHSQTLNVTSFDANTFKIYPNPINGNLLNIEVKQNTRFEIYDILGKKILEGNVTPTHKEVAVSRLNKGVYILKLETPNGTISKKLIKG